MFEKIKDLLENYLSIMDKSKKKKSFFSRLFYKTGNEKKIKKLLNIVSSKDIDDNNKLKSLKDGIDKLKGKVTPLVVISLDEEVNGLMEKNSKNSDISKSSKEDTDDEKDIESDVIKDVNSVSLKIVECLKSISGNLKQLKRFSSGLFRKKSKSLKEAYDTSYFIYNLVKKYLREGVSTDKILPEVSSMENRIAGFLKDGFIERKLHDSDIDGGNQVLILLYQDFSEIKYLISGERFKPLSLDFSSLSSKDGKKRKEEVKYYIELIKKDLKSLHKLDSRKLKKENAAKKLYKYLSKNILKLEKVVDPFDKVGKIFEAVEKEISNGINLRKTELTSSMKANEKDVLGDKTIVTMKKIYDDYSKFKYYLLNKKFADSNSDSVEEVEINSKEAEKYYKFFENSDPKFKDFNNNVKKFVDDVMNLLNSLNIVKEQGVVNKYVGNTVGDWINVLSFGFFGGYKNVKDITKVENKDVNDKIKKLNRSSKEISNAIDELTHLNDQEVDLKKWRGHFIKMVTDHLLIFIKGGKEKSLLSIFCKENGYEYDEQRKRIKSIMDDISNKTNELINGKGQIAEDHNNFVSKILKKREGKTYLRTSGDKIKGKVVSSFFLMSEQVKDSNGEVIGTGDDSGNLTPGKVIITADGIDLGINNNAGIDSYYSPILSAEISLDSKFLKFANSGPAIIRVYIAISPIYILSILNSMSKWIPFSLELSKLAGSLDVHNNLGVGEVNFRNYSENENKRLSYEKGYTKESNMNLQKVFSILDDIKGQIKKIKPSFLSGVFDVDGWKSVYDGINRQYKELKKSFKSAEEYEEKKESILNHIRFIVKNTSAQSSRFENDKKGKILSDLSSKFKDLQKCLTGVEYVEGNDKDEILSASYVESKKIRIKGEIMASAPFMSNFVDVDGKSVNTGQESKNNPGHLIVTVEDVDVKGLQDNGAPKQPGPNDLVACVADLTIRLNLDSLLECEENDGVIKKAGKKVTSAIASKKVINGLNGLTKFFGSIFDSDKLKIAKSSLSFMKILEDGIRVRSYVSLNGKLAKLAVKNLIKLKSVLPNKKVDLI